jgi:serine/threonine protein kinase
LLLDSKFNVKIVDFGYARYFVNDKSELVTYDSSDCVGSLKNIAPEVTNNSEKGSYQADSIDIFAAGCFLFELVMKCEPFKSAEIKDEHYGKLLSGDKKKFWDIFSNKCSPTNEFKGSFFAIQT